MSRPAIVVEDLKKSYGSVEALKGIGFEVPEGTIFGLLGPNGAGKTTAVRILSTILRADSGRAEVLGYDVHRQGGKVRHLIGLAGQNAAVDPNLTGRENLRLIGKLAQLPKSAIKPRADELLERFALQEAGDRTIRTYSGGMRRRLDVAAALVARPPVIFLDEPTTGLDIQSRTELWAVIRELVAEGSTVLLTTQYLEEADQLADRIAVVHGGLVVANDTASALKARLGTTVVEITLASEEQAAQAQSLLARLVVDHPELEGSRVRLSTGEAPRVLTQVLRSLDANGMEAVGVSVRDPSLDDVFLTLTGHTAEEQPAPPPSTPGASRGGPPARPVGSVDPPAAMTGQADKELDEGEEPERTQASSGTAPGRSLAVPGAPRDPGRRLEFVLSQLPYRAGEASMADHLEEFVHSALLAYLAGSTVDPVDVSVLAGYLTLEQRFGRVREEASPQQAATLLLGAVAARAGGLGGSAGGVNGELKDFSREAVRILLEGIAHSSGRRTA